MGDEDVHKCVDVDTVAVVGVKDCVETTEMKKVVVRGDLIGTYVTSADSRVKIAVDKCVAETGLGKIVEELVE